MSCIPRVRAKGSGPSTPRSRTSPHAGARAPTSSSTSPRPWPAKCACSDALIDDVLRTTTREHLVKSWLGGTPGQVADAIAGFVEAGADWVCPMDYASLVLEAEQVPAAFARSIELCRLVKSAVRA